jgi:hypothetical protein
LSEESANKPSIINKSAVTNGLSAGIVVAGFASSNPLILNVGLFALSGAVTNWLAIHMLFEKVPGLYGSGVIPLHFEDFKLGIHELIMEQFFTRENFERFYKSTATPDEGPHFDFEPIIEETDLSPSYDALVAAVMESSFGSMLGMFGGKSALAPLKEPFLIRIKTSLKEITRSDNFQEIVHKTLSSSTASDEMHEKVGDIVLRRLDELTPGMVKDIIQKMIRDHLGWLVVWGGFFGGLIGLAASLVTL